MIIPQGYVEVKKSHIVEARNRVRQCEYYENNKKDRKPSCVGSYIVYRSVNSSPFGVSNSGRSGTGYGCIADTDVFVYRSL